MRKIINKTCSLGLLFLLCNSTISTNTPKNSAFVKLLGEVGMHYDRNRVFREVIPCVNSCLAFEQAIEQPKGLLEVRYVIRPIKNIRIEYDDPHASAPNPDHLFLLLFDTIADRIAGDGYRSKREYPASEAKRLFNAEWAAATAFDVYPQFSSQYKQGILVAMHRSKQADAMSSFCITTIQKLKRCSMQCRLACGLNPELHCFST